jgi:hypothetical protein
MYDGFSDKGSHSTEWFEVAKNFLKLAFADDHREVKCPYNRCWNRRCCLSMRCLLTLLNIDLC